MAFTLSGSPVPFDLSEFETLVTKAGGFTFRWTTSSMGPLRTLAQRKADGAQMRQEIERIARAKAAKYDKALRYLIFHHPGMIPGGEIVNVNNPKKGGTCDTFDRWVAKQTFAREKIAKFEGKQPPPPNVGDLIYGCSAGRDKLGIYKSPNKLICDQFNMASQIATKTDAGKGVFGRYWSGHGSLEATPTSVLRDAKLAAATQTAVSKEAMGAYTETVLGSRYSPDTVFDVPKDKLQKDTHIGLAGMKQNKQSTLATLAKMPASARKELIEDLDPQASPADHMWMHARFVKAVRRACKGGIAMAATHPVFKEHNSKVFFILDQLGDLGNVAFKKALPDKGDYVPITSSELTFVFRYWNHDEVPLSGMLKFFVNGHEVIPPWDGDWRMKDGKGDDVYSNQEAWKRYALYRSVVKPGRKAFPKSGEDEESNA